MQRGVGARAVVNDYSTDIFVVTLLSWIVIGGTLALSIAWIIIEKLRG